MRDLIYFAATLFNGLVAGAAFAIWIDYDPSGKSAPFYVEQMQHAIRVFTIPLPVLVIVAVVSCIASAIVIRKDRTCLILVSVASLCILAVALITAFGNIPINDQIIQWNISAPPSNWRDRADSWWRFQTIRTIAAIVSTSLLITSLLIRRNRWTKALDPAG